MPLMARAVRGSEYCAPTVSCGKHLSHPAQFTPNHARSQKLKDIWAHRPVQPAHLDGRRGGSTASPHDVAARSPSALPQAAAPAAASARPCALRKSLRRLPAAAPAPAPVRSPSPPPAVPAACCGKRKPSETAEPQRPAKCPGDALLRGAGGWELGMGGRGSAPAAPPRRWAFLPCRRSELYCPF